MKYDTLQKTVLRTKSTLIKGRGTKEDIMLMLHRMMNLSQREIEKTMMIVQVMKNML